MVAHQSFINKYYTGAYYHWCPLSQPYAGGDALLTYLGSGWEIHDDVYYEEYWHGGQRRVLIYDFVLVKGGQCVVMHVLTNPFIQRLLYELRLPVLSTPGNRARLRQPHEVLPHYSSGSDTPDERDENACIDAGPIRNRVEQPGKPSSAWLMIRGGKPMVSDELANIGK